MFKVVIIGGMAAGCKAAARLSRLCSEYDITIVERQPYVSFGKCGMPLYASGEIDDFYALSKTANGTLRDEEYFAKVKGVNVLINTEVVKINSVGCEVHCKNLKTEESSILSFHALIIATGAVPVKPDFSISNSHRISPFHSPDDAKNFRETAQRGKINSTVVIGGGFVGCELTESLISLWGIDTVLIEKEDRLMPNYLGYEISKILESRLKKNSVKIIHSKKIEKIEERDEAELITYLNNGKNVNSDYVFYNLGDKPNAALAQECGVKVGEYGGIIVDRKMRTNVPGIWAVGDCTEINNLVTGKPAYFPLGSLASRMGREAADSINGKTDLFIGAAGSISLKVFGLVICASGLTELKAKEMGYDAASLSGCWSDKPDYHPEKKNLFGLVVYERKTLKLLGMQLAGEGEVARYIDIYSSLLAANKTAYDLINTEHAYTPSQSSPISPLNYFGYMIIDKEEEGVKSIGPIEFKSFDGNVVDVREEYEFISKGSLKDAVNIPLSGMRAKLEDIRFDQPTVLICEKGPRAYEAARMLKFNAENNVAFLAGGLIFYNEIFNKLKSKKIIKEEVD